MPTQKSGCLGALLRMFGLRKKDSGVVVHTIEPAVRENATEVHEIEPEPLPYRLRNDFLSTSETSFFQVLKTMIGDRLIICPQVSLAAIFFVLHGDSSQTWLNKIDRKRIDFLLCDPKTLKPVCAIELDDSSHTRSDRQERDAFVEQAFATAGLPLVRVPARPAYNTSELFALIQAAVMKTPAPAPAPNPSADPNGEPPTCPKCGVPMVLRTARRGNTPGQQFYGCLNYPHCNAVIQLKVSAL